MSSVAVSYTHLAVVTFVEHVRVTEFVEKYVYHTVWFCCLWGVLAALAVVVLVKRQLWRHLPALLLHGDVYKRQD